MATDGHDQPNEPRDEEACVIEPQRECPLQRAQGEKRGQPIGTMNGKWAFLLKAVLITTPAAWTIFVTVDLPWRVWVTRATFEASEHLDHATEMNAKLEKHVDAWANDYRSLENRIDGLPSSETRRRLADLEAWERENREDHARIMIALEQIKAKLNIAPGNQPDGARLPLNQENRNGPQTARLGYSDDAVGDHDG